MSGFLKFMAGAVVGGVAVALLTPTTGEDLRARIRECLRRKGIIAGEKLDEAIEMIVAELEEK